MSFKVVVISNKCKLSFKENYLIIDGEKKEHLDYISTIIINTLEVSITSYLINELIKRNINLIFCDEKKNPSSTIHNLYGTGDMYRKLSEQLNYTLYNKGYTWGKIVISKLFMQQKLLYFHTGVDTCLMHFINTVEINDARNCEAFAARTYFNILFGNDFNRREENEINIALNYGYAVLLFAVNRVVVSLGYNTTLGIKHCNKNNDYNFSCDIMEPFRPVVDRIVLENKDHVFDNEYKRKLIKILNESIMYKGRSYKLENAIEVYFLDVVKCLKTGIDEIGKFDFGC